MSRFLAGFVTASALWGLAAALYFSGVLQPAWPQAAPEAAAADAGADAEARDDEASPARRRGARRPRRARRTRQVPRGTATTGDDLGANEARTMDMEGGGGEEQLSSAQVEQAFDGAFGQIRRCLILAAGEEPLRGKLTFGLRIASAGTVSRVNLRGPARVTTGDAGRCLRKQARAIQFPSFDGPDMVVHYPVTLE